MIPLEVFTAVMHNRNFLQMGSPVSPDKAIRIQKVSSVTSQRRYSGISQRKGPPPPCPPTESYGRIAITTKSPHIPTLKFCAGGFPSLPFSLTPALSLSKSKIVGCCVGCCVCACVHQSHTCARPARHHHVPQAVVRRRPSSSRRRRRATGVVVVADRSARCNKYKYKCIVGNARACARSCAGLRARVCACRARVHAGIPPAVSQPPEHRHHHHQKRTRSARQGRQFHPSRAACAPAEGRVASIG
jgi:hypothetical protein